MRRLILPTIFVSVAASALVHGAGGDAPNGVAGNYNGMIGEGVDPYSGNGRRGVEDISSVAGSVGAYPLKWVRTLNTRNGVGLGQFGSGGSWRHSYAWTLGVTIPRPPQDPPLPPEEDYQGPDATVYFPDGKVMEFYGGDERGVPWHSAGTILPGEPDGPGEKIASLHSLGNGHYDLLLTDGGRVEFRRSAYTGSSGETFYSNSAKALVDPYGQRTTLDYNIYGKLERVTEPGGRYLQIVTLGAPGSHGMIGNVKAYDGRGTLLETVSYVYTAFSTGQCLTRVNYGDGTAAFYTYQDGFGGFLVSTCDDVRYAGAMKRIKYEYVGPVPERDEVGGQVWRERNLTTNQIVTEVLYPAFDPYAPPCEADPPRHRRFERRGD
jgi:hypothetical protein